MTKNEHGTATGVQLFIDDTKAPASLQPSGRTSGSNVVGVRPLVLRTRLLNLGTSVRV